MTPTARAISLLVAATSFMEMLDGTVIATALPSMGHDFGVSPVTLSIGITVYLLSLAVFIPISGWTANRFGGRTVFGGAIALFTLASVLCGISGGVASFTAARLLQGAGGAAMVPVGRLIVLRTTDKKDLVAAINLIVWPALVAPVLGPPLGGFLAVYLSWRWIFFINLPLGLAALAVTVALVSDQRPTDAAPPLDRKGFLLSGIALAALVYGIDALGGTSEPVLISLALIVFGLGVGTAAVRHFLRSPAPLLDLSALRIPTFAVVMWGGSLLRIAIGTMPFLLPLFFQLGFGLDPVTSGGLVLFVFAGNLSVKAVVTRTLRRFGFRQLMLGSGAMASLAIVACAALTPATPYLLIAAVLFAGGVFRSLQFSCLSAIQFADVPPARMADANTLASMMQQLMLGLGVVVGSLVLEASAAVRGGAGPVLADFRIAFCVVAVIGLAGLIDTVRLDRAAGAHVSGHRA